jgi:hypothetical protein
MTSAESPLTEQNGVAVARAVGDAVFQASPSRIRQFATELREHAQNLRTLTGEPLVKVSDSLNREAQAFTTDHQVPPIYTDTVAALTTTTDRFKVNLTSLADQLDGDSDALTWLANMIENDQEALAASIREAGPDGESGGPSTFGSIEPGGDSLLGKNLEELKKQIGADVGIAYMPLFGDDREVKTMGDLQKGDGWSTMKAPVVLAALHDNGGQVTEDMRQAITSSDNDAANRVWASLGAPQEAAQKVQSVLNDAGDTTTSVNAIKDPDRATAFGQTQWSLGNQLKFMDYLSTDPAGAPLRTLMSQVDGSQQWGLGQVDSTMFKGGWGPDAAGQYMTRQMGIVDGPGGPYAVAIMVAPNSGDFGDSQTDMTQVSKWLDLR